eukprot:g5743.t1
MSQPQVSKPQVCALLSGGKDSCFNMMLCEEHGYEIAVLANLYPVQEILELDSFMYQTASHNMISVIADAMELPLVRRGISGTSKSQGLTYSKTDEDEVEDLYELLADVKRKYPNVSAVSCGAILSNYQRNRVEDVCARLNLRSLSFMWERQQGPLLREMANRGVESVIVKTAAMGLKREHLGKTIGEVSDYLHKCNSKFGLHICGEGGEFETLTLNCPLYKKRIVVDEAEVVTHHQCDVAPVLLWHIKKYHLEEKLKNNNISNPNMTAQRKSFTKPEMSSKALELSSHLETKQTYKVVRTAALSVPPSSNPDESISEEMERLLTHLKTELSLQDCLLTDCVHVRLYLRRMSDFGLVNKVYASHFGCRNPPSRSCVELPFRTGAPNIQISAVAVPGSGSDLANQVPTSIRSCLHIRSWSRWAPVCIGPYSQCNRIGPWLHMAGQIGLIPEKMCLVKGGWATELLQALRNCAAVLDCEGSNMRHVAFCSLFISAAAAGLDGDGLRLRENGASAICDAATAMVSDQLDAYPSLYPVEGEGDLSNSYYCHGRGDWRLLEDEAQKSTAKVRENVNNGPGHGNGAGVWSGSTFSNCPVHPCSLARSRRAGVPVMTVVVPYLPKGAAVELEMFALQVKDAKTKLRPRPLLLRESLSPRSILHAKIEFEDDTENCSDSDDDDDDDELCSSPKQQIVTRATCCDDSYVIAHCTVKESLSGILSSIKSKSEDDVLVNAISALLLQLKAAVLHARLRPTDIQAVTVHYDYRIESIMNDGANRIGQEFEKLGNNCSPVIACLPMSCLADNSAFSIQVIAQRNL